MSEYFSRLIELTKLNFEFFIDYWWLHIGAIVVLLALEFTILAKRESNKRDRL